MKNKKDKYLIKILFIVFAFLLILNFCCSCELFEKPEIQYSKYPKGIIEEIEKSEIQCDCKIRFLRRNDKPYSSKLIFNLNCDSIKVGDTVDLNIRRK